MVQYLLVILCLVNSFHGSAAKPTLTIKVHKHITQETCLYSRIIPYQRLPYLAVTIAIYVDYHDIVNIQGIILQEGVSLSNFTSTVVYVLSVSQQVCDQLHIPCCDSSR